MTEEPVARACIPAIAWVPAASEKKKKSKWAMLLSKVEPSARVAISPPETDSVRPSPWGARSFSTWVQEKAATVAAARAARIICLFITFISLDYREGSLIWK